jgi:hypothetical protein
MTHLKNVKDLMNCNTPYHDIGPRSRSGRHLECIHAL